VIEFKNVSKHFGQTQVLHNIDLQINQGEVVVIIGPSGSGKSSLIAILGGLERPTGGTVRVLGHALELEDETGRTRLRRDRMGVVFQSYHLVPAMTALQNVSLPLMLAGRDDASDRARDMLVRVGLSHRLDHRPTALSGGEQQRVAIARAFVHAPALILADEPTGNLDQATGEDIAALMFELTRANAASLLLVTHDPALAESCDRALRIENGIVNG
jgi:putative ABC transport system ATP-binding protein